MAIREAARQAWVTARSDREGEVRAFLADLLAPFDVSLLTTRDVQVTDTFTLFVLCDADDDVCLGVRRQAGNWQVFVVQDSDGWTIASEQVKSLAHLHTLLPPVSEPAPDPSYPQWVQPTGAHDAYALGDRVTHQGKVWESLVDGNVWQPPTSWREVV